MEVVRENLERLAQLLEACLGGQPLGLGLIGGSLASAIRAHGLAQTVVGYDARADELALGVALGVIDQAADSLAQAVRGSDLVMLAVPVRAANSPIAIRSVRCMAVFIRFPLDLNLT